MRYNTKATLRDLTDSYQRTKNFRKAAEEFGMCHQAVWRRLKSAGVLEGRVPKYRSAPKPFSVAERELIREVYKAGFQKGHGALKALGELLHRRLPNICNEARSLGLTNLHREYSQKAREENSARMQGVWDRHQHPKGMLGKKFTTDLDVFNSDPSKYLLCSKETRARGYLKHAETLLKNGTWMRPHDHKYRRSWRVIGEQRIFARSRWEANYGRYLELLRSKGELQKWEHEAELFVVDKEKGLSYLPDFRVTLNDGSVEYHEVKGWMCERSVLKLEQMHATHPHIKLILIQEDWFKKAETTTALEITGWEFTNTPERRAAKAAQGRVYRLQRAGYTPEQKARRNTLQQARRLKAKLQLQQNQ